MFHYFYYKFLTHVRKHNILNNEESFFFCKATHHENTNACVIFLFAFCLQLYKQLSKYFILHINSVGVMLKTENIFCFELFMCTVVVVVVVNTKLFFFGVF